MDNIDYFLTCEEQAFRSYKPNVSKFKAAQSSSATKIITTSGIDSKFPPNQYSAGLTEKLGKTIVYFPGNHVGGSLTTKRICGEAA
ncbi:hypothetical protein [Virgibacillus ndiopensis]|uniref:hypothetical protein n=1 Tax=Virgibacillus ndiopensis TaxID=2004408 RepID=UPI000C08047D|nr:hypothetical protein [Virgibacillus ndiopensis]